MNTQANKGSIFRHASPLPVGVGSGHVMTVLGPLPVEQMGVTLMHEHILVDASGKWSPPACCSERPLSEAKVHIGILGALRMNPFVNRDNCQLFDPELAIEELMHYKDLGGQTVVDPTTIGLGRDPLALQRISRRTGLHIVSSAGFYLEFSHPDFVRDSSIDELAARVVFDVGGATEKPEVIAGIIGEIGVGANFTDAEQKSLRAAARASAETGVPLSVHLPAWKRHGHRVLDLAEEEGADLNHTILCHMNPSHMDVEYQHSLAKRGAWLEYDMIGIENYFPYDSGQSPSDEQSAAAIRALIDAGFINRLLLSQDTFMKMQMVSFGGNGYGYLLEHFVPRLRRHGVADEAIETMLIANPRKVFSSLG